MTHLTLVAGVKTQLDQAAPAAELYLSHWFRLAKTLAEARGPWMILSAQYGLLTPDEHVQPYGQTQQRGGRGPVRDLAFQLLDPLLAATESGQRLSLFSLSERYFEALRGPLMDAGRQLEAPLHGLSLSQQVQWLEAQLAKDGIAPPPHRQRSEREKTARRERRAARRKGTGPSTASTPPGQMVEQTE